MNRRAEKGFTLVEVMASMVIFSTAILGLMHAGAENIRAVSIIEEKQIAGIIADNQIILALNSDQPLRPGAKTEQLEMNGLKWDWELLTEETEMDGFLKLTLNVRAADNERIIITRTAFGHPESAQ